MGSRQTGHVPSLFTTPTVTLCWTHPGLPVFSLTLSTDLHQLLISSSWPHSTCGPSTVTYLHCCLFK